MLNPHNGYALGAMLSWNDEVPWCGGHETSEAFLLWTSKGEDSKRNSADRDEKQKQNKKGKNKMSRKIEDAKLRKN